MNLAIIGATTTQPAPAYMQLLPFVVLAAAYFLWFRPRMKKIQAERTRVTAFALGDQVQTVGGLIATAVSENDGIVTVRTASGLELDFVRRAIAGPYVAPVSEESPTNNEKPQES